MKKLFLFFLLDTPTGKAYYLDSNHVIQSISIISATDDVSMSSSPGGWLDTELGFIRNSTYYGLNRSYTTSQEFVKDVAYMVRKLYIDGVGTETPLTVAVFKYNSRPQAGEPVYKLYYKAPVDLPKIKDKIIESVNCNLMEGGVTQLLKAYENTQIQIPCDGSIGENIKANLDGLKVSNTVYFDIVPSNYNNGQVMVAMTKVREDGDSFGSVTGNPTIQDLSPSTIWQTSNNYSIYFNLPTTVRVRGSITVRIKTFTGYQFATGTSKSQFLGGQSVSYAKSLVWTDIAPYPNPFALPHPSYPSNTYPPQVRFQGEQTFYFDVLVPLSAYEKLFFWQTTTGVAGDTEIVSGNVQLSFATMYPSTRVWGINIFECWKRILFQVCQLANIQGFNFNYKAESTLLEKYKGIIVASGDAIRASGDPNYQRFFHPADISGNISYGPVIKTSIREFFDSVHAIFCAALGNQQAVDEIEALFIESMEYVFDSSAVTMELGEVTDLEWSFDEQNGFSDLQLGYIPQTYDQNAGKYEYNTTAKYKAPINSFQKELVKISKYRTDSYGIERLRSNIGQPTSTTRNDSDNSVFLISTDEASWIYDYFRAYFESQVTDPDSGSNTNINLLSDRNNQPVSLQRFDGEYFQPKLDQAIFVFNETGYSASESCTLDIQGVINSVNHVPGQPADTITLKLWLNGVELFSQTITVAGVNTPIAITYPFTQLLQFSDCIYVTASTSATGVADITTCILTIGTYVEMTGQFIPVEGGTPVKLLSMPTVVPSSYPYDGSSKMYYGYQYFQFNSLNVNTDFTITASVEAYTSGTSGNITVWFYINGVRQSTALDIPCQATRTLQNVSVTFPAPQTYVLGDVVFMTVDVPSGMNIGITDMAIQWDSNYIKAYSLLRYAYDSISGIPNIATDPITGLPSTTVAGAPYNIEPLTPARMYERWAPFIKSCFLDKVAGNMSFQTLSKNQYLNTVYLGKQYVEAANRQILNADRLFYPVPVTFKTKVPLNFAEILTGAANGHVHCTYFGYDIYFFPMDVKQKPGLNESQVWKGLLSPKTDLKILADINIDGLKLLTMGDNTIFCPVLSSVQFVPLNQTQPVKYHTKNRSYFLFKEQIGLWMNQMNWYQPVQIGDIIPLQFITRGLDPVTYTVYKCDGTEYIAATNLTTISSAAVVNPYVLWQTLIDTASWERDDYYIIIRAGVGDIASVLRSEYLAVQTADELEDTVLCEYTSSFNTQQMIFDGNIPFTGSMRFKGGFNNKFKQKYLGKFYVDQPADISITGAIPYETGSLIIGGTDGGVPDYMAKKLLRALTLDGCKLDGEGFSLNEGAQLEEVFTKGAPLKFQRVEIRPTDNNFGIVVNADGIDTDGSIIATIDAEAFGPNANNASGTTQPNIIDIIVN